MAKNIDLKAMLKASTEKKNQSHEKLDEKKEVSKAPAEELVKENKSIKEPEKKAIKEPKKADKVSIEISENKAMYLKLKDIIKVANIRTSIPEEVQDMAASIDKIGQLQPVLITLDKHLISGYTRCEAMEYLKREDIAVFYYPKNYKDMSQLEFDQIQFAENEERNSLDHLDISKLFNKYIEAGKNQSEIAKEFGKNKGYVSAVISFKRLDDTIIKYLKEFKYFAWSHKMFTMVNNSEDAVNNKWYVQNRAIVGWKVIYDIAKHEDVQEQKKVFLQKFKNRLTEEELNDKYFEGCVDDKKDIPEDIKKKEHFEKTMKSMEEASKGITDFISNPNASETQKKNYAEAMELMAKARMLMLTSGL